MWQNNNLQIFFKGLAASEKLAEIHKKIRVYSAGVKKPTEKTLLSTFASFCRIIFLLEICFSRGSEKGSKGKN